MSSIRHTQRNSIRDGSGKQINSRSFDEIACSSYFGRVKLDSLYGLIDIKTGELLIPCTMDRIEEPDFGSGLITEKDGQLGHYDIPPSMEFTTIYIGLPPCTNLLDQE